MHHVGCQLAAGKRLIQGASCIAGLPFQGLTCKSMIGSLLFVGQAIAGIDERAILRA